MLYIPKIIGKDIRLILGATNIIFSTKFSVNVVKYIYR